MSDHGRSEREYVVPTYRAPEGAVWYHFLYGSIPGHQIDFIVRPEVPHGPLSPQHFSHLLRLIKYIEAREGSPFAFAIANLSRDDTQHVPGHGGLALIFGLRVRDAADHAGRPEPPFSHVIAAIDRELDENVIEAAALSFYRRMVGSGAGDSEGVALYRAYAALAGADRRAAAALAARYVEAFEGLPGAPRGSVGQRWRAEDPEAARRIFVVHPDGASFSEIAPCAARLAAILYRSDVRWTSITTGREADLAHGVSIFLVPEREARGHSAGGGLVVRMSEIPRSDADAARALFGARPIDRRVITGRVPAAGNDIDDAPTLQMPHEPSEPAEAAPRRPGYKRWPFLLAAGSFLCGVALTLAWALRSERALTLEPFSLEVPAAIAASAPSAPPEEAIGHAGVKQGDRQAGMVAPSAPPAAAPAKSPPQRAAARGAFGRRKPEEKAVRAEKTAPVGPIYRDLPPP